MTNKNLKQMAEQVLKTMEDSANSGAEMLPEEWADYIIPLIREKSWCRQLFADNTWKMKNDTQKVPAWSGAITGYGVGDTDSSEPSASSPSTASVTLSMKTFMAKVKVKNKWKAYGIDQLAKHLENEIVAEFVELEADAIVNGDTTGPSDSSNINGSLSSGDLKLQFDGLRKKNFDSSVTNVNASGNALSLSDLRDGIKELSNYANPKSDLVLLVSLNTSADMLGWDELETKNEYGENATIMHGEIGRIKAYGIRVVETDKVPTNLNASGKYDGVTTDRTVALLFKKQTAMLGIPAMADRKFHINAEAKPGLDQVNLYPTEDLAFNVQWDDAIVQIYNIST